MLCPLRIFLKSYVCKAWKNHVLTWLYLNISNMTMIQLCICSFMFLSNLGSGLEVTSVSEYVRLLVSQSRATKKSCQRVKVTADVKSLWMMVGFSSLSFFCSGKLQEQFVRRSLHATGTRSDSAERGMAPKCVHRIICVGGPLPVKGSARDLVVLITKNLKYCTILNCRCGVTDLRGPLSHIPKFRTASQPACSSASQGRKALCVFCRWEMTVAPRNASCPLWVRVRLKGLTSRCNEVFNVNFSSI